MSADRPPADTPSPIEYNLHIEWDPQKETIAVDIDDVLAEATKALLQYVAEHYGKSVSVEEYSGFWEQIWPEHKNEPATLQRLGRDATDAVLLGLAPIDGALNTLQVLRKNYNLIVVTSRRQEQVSTTVKWIEKYFPGIFCKIFFSGIHDINDGQHNKRNKSGLLTNEKVVCLIDDEIRHATGFAETGGQSILFGNYPWNRDAPENPKIFCASDWEDVASFFRRKVDGDII